MSDIFSIWSSFSGYIINFLIYILGLITDVIIKRVLPEDKIELIEWKIKDKIKSIQNINLNIYYNIKTNEKILDKSIIKTINENIKKIGFTYIGDPGGHSVFEGKSGELESQFILKPDYRENDIGELYLHQLEIEIKPKIIKYNEFELTMIDLINTKYTLQSSLNEIFGEFYSECLICELSNFYKFTGLLHDFDTEYLQGKLGGHLVDFAPKSIIIYGKVDKKLIKVLKKVIAFYY